jgi:hypothetical protein
MTQVPIVQPFLQQSGNQRLYHLLQLRQRLIAVAAQQPSQLRQQAAHHPTQAQAVSQGAWATIHLPSRMPIAAPTQHP